LVSIQNRPVHNRPLITDHSKQTTFITDPFITDLFITDPFIIDPFATDHVDKGPLLIVYCSVDVKSPNHFA